VALSYKAGEMEAPTVVAKGARLMAQKIKEIAREHGVPVIEDKPLARALFKSVEIGQPVPPALYRAVAEILAYVFRLRGRRS
jgi:flagellar biosynthesis protein FlhB